MNGTIIARFIMDILFLLDSKSGDDTIIARHPLIDGTIIARLVVSSMVTLGVVTGAERGTGDV